MTTFHRAIHSSPTPTHGPSTIEVTASAAPLQITIELKCFEKRLAVGITLPAALEFFGALGAAIAHAQGLNQGKGS